MHSIMPTFSKLQRQSLFLENWLGILCNLLSGILIKEVKGIFCSPRINYLQGPGKQWILKRCQPKKMEIKEIVNFVFLTPQKNVGKRKAFLIQPHNESNIHVPKLRPRKCQKSATVSVKYVFKCFPFFVSGRFWWSKQEPRRFTVCI